MSTHGPCDKCEELLHGYLDRVLSEAEMLEAEAHLDLCDFCRRRYRFEESLRVYIRVSAVERIPAGLLAKLNELRASDAPT